MPVFYLNFNRILGFIAAISLFPSYSLQNPVSARSISLESIPLAPVTGPITAQFVSEASGFDGPKLSAVNSTSYDWWYFDVASADLQSSVILTFFTAGGSAITNPFGTTVPWAFLVGTFPNGTAFQYYFAATSPAVVITDDDGSSGSWSGTGLGWSGTSDLTQYTILIDIPALNVSPPPLPWNSWFDIPFTLTQLNILTSRHLSNCNFINMLTPLRYYLDQW
jgi:hypothetical protein